MDTTDILVIGAGPCGLAVGVAAKRAGLGCVLLDRRTIVSTIERYPLGMTFFSAGLDLSELTERNTTEAVMHSRMWHRVFDAIQFGKVPVVAVLHGAVVGGGLELAAACHLRVAERSAYYALPEGSRGIFLGGGGSVRLPRLIGVSRVMELMLTGRTYGAEEGQTYGLSHLLVDDGKGLATGMELAERVATNAPMSNFAIMHALPRIAESHPANGLFAESLMASVASNSEDAKTRLRDFLEKRGKKVTRE